MRTERYYHTLTARRETFPSLTSEEIAEQVRAFQAAGGQIQQIPIGASGLGKAQSWSELTRAQKAAKAREEAREEA